MGPDGRGRSNADSNSRALTPLEYNRPAMRDRMRDFNEFIKKKFGDSIRPPPKETVKDPYPEDDTETGEPNDEQDVYKPYEGLYGKHSLK